MSARQEGKNGPLGACMVGRIRRPSILQGHQISSETIRSYRKRCKIDLNEIR